MARKRPQTEYDQHIIDALIRLDNPIVGKDKKHFYIRSEARRETGLQHIANRKHRLKVRDIEMIPSFLKHPKYECADPLKKNYRNYYGIRESKNAMLFIKIVTWVNPSNPNIETIITIYPTSTIKVE